MEIKNIQTDLLVPYEKKVKKQVLFESDIVEHSRTGRR